MTPKESMREYCRQCLCIAQYSTEKVKNCGGDKARCGPCPFYSFRIGRVSVKIFRKNCLYCQGGNRAAVEECNIADCPCYQYRFGKNPAMKDRKGNPNMSQIRSMIGAGM